MRGIPSVKAVYDFQDLRGQSLRTKKWYEVLDFYRLTGIVLLWISAWLFMMPHEFEVNAPFFDNIWGASLSALGLYKNQVSAVQQSPDLMTALASVFLMILLQFRGIFRVAVVQKKDGNENGSGLLLMFMNLFSIIVHSLFFSVVFKMFFFPNGGTAETFYATMKENIGITVFAACCITGIILGVPSISRLLLVLLFCVGIFKNVSMVSRIMGTTGFVAAILAVLGFFLEFSAGGFDKERFLMELAILSGRYEKLYNASIFERNAFAANHANRSFNKTDAKSKKSLLKKAELFSGGQDRGVE